MLIVLVCVLLAAAACILLVWPRGDSVRWQLSLFRSIRALGWFLVIPVLIAVEQLPSQTTSAGRSMFGKVGIISAVLATIFIIGGHIGVRRFR